jgi:M6 family metalloprotease-like protein
MVLFGAACGAPPSEPAEIGRRGEAVVTGTRPVVAILTQLPGPTAAKDAQWSASSVVVGRSIPDNWTPGVDSDVTPSNVGGGACSALLQIHVDISLTHPRVAELMVSLETINANGLRIDGTMLFDGPALAAGKTAAEIAKIQLPGGFDVPQLLKGTDCSRFRINVADLARGNTGTLDSWTLKRRTAWFPFAHTANDYERLIFGTTSIAGPRQTPNLQDFYREESRGQLLLSDAGVFGPVAYSAWDPLENDSKHVADVVHMLEAAGFDFAAHDANHDGAVTGDELEIIAIDNGSDVGGANRSNADGKGCTQLVSSALKVCTQVALVAQQTDFETLAHELSHSFGTIDLYGAWGSECYSYGLTLMSCTISFADNPATLYHDPWHRYKLGWVTPLDPGFPTGSSYEMGDESWSDGWGNRSRPAILRNSAPASYEYFLFEYRDQRGYDANVASAGIVAWHVREDANGNCFDNGGKDPQGHHVYAVGPDKPAGASQAWTPASGRFRLAWESGAQLPYVFWVTEDARSFAAERLNWAPVPAGIGAPTVRILSPSDGASGVYGLGTNVVLKAQVIASDGATDNSSAVWSSDVDGPLGSGALLTTNFMKPGKRVITVVGKDKYGGTAKASVTYTASDVAPWVHIDSPTGGQTFYRNQPVRLQASGHTPVAFALPCASITWTDSASPGWSAAEGGDNVTCWTTQTFDRTGDLTLNATAVDDHGNSGSASVTVHVIDPPPASPPIVTINDPADGAREMTYATVHIDGTVTDPAGGGAVSYRWTVQPSGGGSETQISTAAAFDWVPSSAYPEWSTQEVTLRLYGNSSAGKTTVASHTLWLEAPPR